MIMKKVKKTIAPLLCSMLFLIGAPLSNIDATAGSSINYIMSKASVSGSSINQGDFFVEGAVYAKENKIVFDEKSEKTASIISKSSAINYKEFGIEELFSLTLKMNVEEIVSGGKIALAFGLKRSRDSVGAKDSAEIYMTYDGGLYLGVNEYKESDKPTVICESRKYSLFSLNSVLTFNLKVDVNGKIYLSVVCNGKEVKILSGKSLSVDASGSMGVVSVSTEDERNKFTISSMEAISYTYDVPQTVDHYIETFEDKGYNANMFYSQSWLSPFSPSGMYLEDGQLVFRNTGPCYFSTKEVYSNFELKFDIPFLAREALYDEEGNITQLISNWFMIGFGIKNHNDLPTERLQASFVQFDFLQHDSPTKKIDHANPTPEMINNRFVLWHHGAATSIVSMGEQNIWNKDYVGDKTVNIKLTVVDGILDLYYKLDDEESYGASRFHYEFESMQTGYVRLYSYGDGSIPSHGIECTSVLNMRIDNFEITNLDKKDVRPEGKIIPFKTNIFKTAEDFVYTTKPDPTDLLMNKLKK